MRIGPFLLVLGLGWAGCGDEAHDPDERADLGDAATRFDGSAGETGADAGPGGGGPADAGGGGADGGAADGGPMATPDPENAGFAGCFNGRDDSGNGLVDCEDSACGASAYCCVGDTSATCCTGAGAAIDATFSGCADPRDCVSAPEVDWFGTPRPTIEDAAFVPNGDTFDDSGLVLGPVVDPTRERVVLQASIAAPIDGCSDCLDVVALGLADPPTADDVRVVPDVALMVRASRRDYALIVAGEVVGQHPLETSAPRDYRLELAPDGTVTLQVGSDPVLTARGPVRPGRAPLLYGRTHNRTGLVEPARVESLSVRTFGCDIPSAMDRGESAVIPFEGVEWGSRVASSPSIVPDGDDTLVAFALSGDVHLARGTASGSWMLGGSGRVEAPVLVPEPGERFDDPELLREDDRFVVYLTHVTPGGTTVARALGEAGHAEVFGRPEALTLPDDLTYAESPSVVDDDGVRWLAVRTFVEDEPRVVLLEATDGDGLAFDWAGGTLEDSVLVSRRADDRLRFDTDEVSDPELVIDGAGLMRVFYAGRRGTRWGIGVRVSGDRATWREPVDHAVLAGSGAGHDALWARHPTATITDGRLELFYTASDGVALDIGRAVGRAP